MACLQDFSWIKTLLAVAIFLALTVGVVVIMHFAGVFSSAEEAQLSPGDGANQGEVSPGDGANEGQSEGRKLQGSGNEQPNALIRAAQEAASAENETDAFAAALKNESVAETILSDLQNPGYLETLDQDTLSENIDIIEERMNRASEEYHTLIQNYKDLYLCQEWSEALLEGYQNIDGELDDPDVSDYYVEIYDRVKNVLGLSHDDLMNGEWDDTWTGTLETKLEQAKSALEGYEGDKNLAPWNPEEHGPHSKIEQDWLLTENEREQYTNALARLKTQSAILNNNIIPQAPLNGGEFGNGNRRLRRLLAVTCA